MPHAVESLASDRTKTPWGMLAALDRHGCERDGRPATQFAETSSTTVHGDELRGRCFADVVSCRRFHAAVAAAVAVEHSAGTPALRVLQR